MMGGIAPSWNDSAVMSYTVSKNSLRVASNCAACRPWEVRYWREGHVIPLCCRCRACLALIGSVLNDEGDVEHVLATVTA